MSALPRGTRLVGTWDKNGTMLFSLGSKNFKTKTDCAYCQQRMPMMHRFATAKKGEAVEFNETEQFCNLKCYRSWRERRERDRNAREHSAPGGSCG